MFWSRLTALLAVAPLVWSAPQQLNIGNVVNGDERAPFSSDPRVGLAANGAALVTAGTGTEGQGVQLWLDCASEGERALEAASAVAEMTGWS